MARFILLFLFASFFPVDDLQQGIQYFNNRALVVKGLQSDATNINKAIQIFEKELAKDPKSELAGFYYLQCLNYKGRFVVISNSDKKAVFNKAIVKGNELVKLYPNNGALRFSLITSIGLLAEISGVLKSAESGVVGQMLHHSQMLIKTDSMYNYGAGWKVLAILHYKTPKIPVVMEWPNKKYALILCQKALKYFPADISNNYYYAEALLENGDEQKAKIYFQLAIKFPTRKELLLEDEYLKLEAKKVLQKLN